MKTEIDGLPPCTRQAGIKKKVLKIKLRVLRANPRVHAFDLIYHSAQALPEHLIRDITMDFCIFSYVSSVYPSRGY